MKNLTMEEKIYRMFILGMNGEKLEENPNLIKALRKGLGGVIFFTENIKTAQSFKKLITDIKGASKYASFLSIDQEGGRVERTENIHNGKKYLSAKDAAEKGELFVKEQSKLIAEELNSYGLNMNFAPVLDVNTNYQNPIIGSRAYSDKPELVAKYGKIFMNELMKKGIIPVAKHYPGHGNTKTDSHTTLPEVDLKFENLKKIHIKPFEELIKDGIPAIMAAHVHYQAFDRIRIPGSISPNVLGYLRNELNFEGLIISDDMIMGGVKDYTAIDACSRGINAGINTFIFRNSDNETIEVINELIKKVKNKEIDPKKIDYAIEKIEHIHNILRIEN